MTKRMYGDLVTALTGGVGNVLFFYEVMLLFNAIQKKEDASMKGLVGPLLIAATQSFKVIFSFWSFLYQSKLASVAAFGFQIYFHFLVGMFGWPAPFAEILLPMFVWQLITVSANTPHPFFVKMAFVFVSTTNMMILSVLSPTESFQANLPVICACTAIFVSFEYGILMIYSSGTIDKFRYDEMERQQPLSLSSMLKWENLRKWGGTIVCLVTFAYVMMTQMASVLHKEGYVAASSNDLVSTFFFGLFGLVCTGAFRDRFISEQARLSAEKVIAKENTSVRVATMALNASETATAVVDKERLLVMYNTAFQKMCCESDTDLRGKQLEGALNLSAEDTCALTNSFEDTGVREIQLTVSGKPVCIKAIASSMDPESFIEDNRYFHIVLRDLQRERDLAQAASLGQQEALKTLALVRDIEALSYMYNRPFLPEIDVVPNHIDDLADVEV